MCECVSVNAGRSVTECEMYRNFIICEVREKLDYPSASTLRMHAAGFIEKKSVHTRVYQTTR